MYPCSRQHFHQNAISEILILGGRFCLLPKRYAADIRTMESDDARCVDCSWIVGGSMGAGRVLLRQPERGRRASKIHAIKTNNLAGADLGRCTSCQSSDGIENVRMFAGTSVLGVGVLLDVLSRCLLVTRDDFFVL